MTVIDLHPRKRAAAGCLAKDGETRCARPAIWSLTFTCASCGMRGGGPSCAWHKVQADDWGVPHYGPSGGACTANATSHAVPLR